MRISIRNQLVLLVLLCTLVALAILTAATWVNNYNFVLDITDQRMSLVASLKANELATNLGFIQTSVQLLCNGARVQNALRAYNAGNSNQTIFDDIHDVFDRSFGGFGPSTLAVQAVVWAQNGSVPGNYSLVNATKADTNLVLPYNHTDGTPVTLGEPHLGYPDFLYPDISQAPSGKLYFGQQELGPNSNILLGPIYTASRTALISLTLPILDVNKNITSTNILGWMTMTFDARVAMQYISSPQGLGNTGTVLLISPDTRNNRFPGALQNAHFPVNDPTLKDERVRFVNAPDESRYAVKRHVGSYNTSITLSQYPALLQGLGVDHGTPENSGTVLSTHNEQGSAVTIGYAIPDTPLCTWLLVVEMSKDEVWAPIRRLRNVILACVFSTAFGMLIFIWPMAHLYTRPIRRLREATKGSVQPPRTPTPDMSLHTSAMSLPPPSHTGSVSPPLTEKKGFRVRLKSWTSVQPKETALVDDTAASRGFRVPARVKDRKHWIHDELTDLTATFNTMSDELLKQYTELDERVRQRTRELEISARAAQAANESKTLFIANISHELKTPLNGILGMCAVSMQEDDPEKIKASLGIIYKSGDLLHNLLTDLLTFSKNEVGKQLMLEEKRFSLNDISVQLHAIFDKQASDKKIDFDITLQRPDSTSEAAESTSTLDLAARLRDARLYGDYHRILQIIINLVSNSLKFTPARGKVEVRATCTSVVESPAAKPRQPTSRSYALSKVLSYGKRSSHLLSKKSSSAAGSVSGSVSESPGRLSAVPAPLSDSEDERRSSLLEIELDQDAEPVPPPDDAPTVWFDIEVQDTGPGIPEHLQEDIFKPFVQGDLRLTKRYGGTGLGLSICSQLATLLKGKISVTSVPGQGSTFVLRIPLRLAGANDGGTLLRTPSATHSETSSIAGVERRASTTDTDTPHKARKVPSMNFELSRKPRLVGLSQPFFSHGALSPSKSERSKHNNLRVLVAEDNKVNQEVVLRMLKLEDIFDVSLAHDGQEALEAVKENMKSDGSPSFDLIFMDVQMPNLDGRQSARLIREAGCKAPIVALTAFADETNKRECLESGMDDFLAKPIRRPALKQVLKTFCSVILEEDEEDLTTPGSKMSGTSWQWPDTNGDAAAAGSSRDHAAAAAAAAASASATAATARKDIA